MPDLVLYGKIVTIYPKSFQVMFIDEDNIQSIATIINSSIKEDERSSIVVGNTVEYSIDGTKETIHVNKLRVWTQQDEDNAKKRIDEAQDFLDELDKND